MDKKYTLDSNVLISSSRLYYPFDIAPSFWDQLVKKGSDKIVIVDRIKDEILRNKDSLSDWLRANLDEFSQSSSQKENVIQAYSEIISYVNKEQQYTEVAKREFADVADSWVCAHALANSHIVVTEEQYEANSRKKIKIPNVCECFNIACINRLQFIREIKVRL